MKASRLSLVASEVSDFLTFDALPIGCILIDRGQIQSVNNCFSDLVGIPKHECSSKAYSELIKSVALDQFLGSDPTAYTGQKNIEGELKTKVGFRPVAININTNVNGSYESSILTFTELQDKRTEVSLNKSAIKHDNITEDHATLSAVMNSSTDGISAIDTNYCVVAYNHKAKEEFKKFVNVDLEIGLNFKDAAESPKEFERWKTIYDRAFAGESFSKIVKRDNGTQIFRNVYTPVRNNNKAITGVLEISRDITESVLAQEAIEFREYQFRTLVEHSPSGLVKIDLTGIIKYVSPRVEEMIRLTSDKIIGKHITEFLVPGQAELFTEAANKLFNGEADVYNTINGRRGDGTLIHMEGVATMLRNEKGNPEEFFLSVIDVSEKQHTKKQLMIASGKYDSLFANTKNAIIVYDLVKGKNEDCNQAAMELFGMEKKDLLEINNKNLIPEFTEYLPGVNQHNLLKETNKKLKDNKPVEDQMVAIHQKGGGDRLTKLSVVRTDQKGDTVYLILSDETLAYRNLQLITEKSSIYEALIHNSFDGIDIIKYNNIDDYIANGKLVVRNTRMKKMLGNNSKKLYDTVEDLVSISPEFQLDGKLSSEVIQHHLLDTIRKGTTALEYRFEHSGGVYDTVASQKLIEIDNYIYLIKNYRDISDEVKQRQIINDQLSALNSKNDEMKKYIESNLQLENFAYIASHDLKAPIRSVISFAQLLKNNSATSLDEKNAKFLDIIISASTNMQVLIDDLLSFSRINTQAIEFEEVDMPKLVNHLLIEIQQAINEVNGEVKILSLPDSIVCDASRIRQIFQNLIMNGMKFCKAKETPKVEISWEEKYDKHIFAIKDFGIGIEPEYLKEIFLMFKKLHSENKYKGTGIGLSICKKIVEQHQGDIWAESDFDDGATFYFSISKELAVNI